MKRISTLLVLALAFALVANVTLADTGYQFTKTLKKGSTGADVVALQTLLVSKNLLTMPAGVAMGYFGNLTVSAVKAYQASKGISTVGQVGPATRAALNAEGAVVTVPGTTIPTVPTTGITTPGVEGTISVSAGPVANTNVYVGGSKVQVLNLKLQAQNSDISAQRVQVDLGTNSAIYTKAFTTLYVIADNGTVLASLPLNQTTVTKDGTRFFATLTGFNYIVSKNSSRYLTIGVDVAPSVDTTYQIPYTFGLAASGVRGVDGAGIVEYTNNVAQGLTQAVTVNASLADSADLKISTNGATPATGAVIANSGSTNDQADKVTVLVFDVKAEKDAIGITGLNASTTMTGTATLTGAYLYDGSTLVASAAVSNGSAMFTNIGGTTGYVIPKDTTKTFTIQVDIRSASSTPGSLSATIAAAGVSAQNSQGTTLAGSVITGNAGSNTLTVQKAGPVFTLAGTPSVSKSIIGTTASSTFATGFTFVIAAKGTNVTVASTSAFVIGIYVNGSRVATTSATYSRPVTGTTLEAVTGNYVIADGQAATFTAQTSFVGPNATYTPAGGIVTARLESAINGGNTYLSETYRAEPSTPVTL